MNAGKQDMDISAGLTNERKNGCKSDNVVTRKMQFSKHEALDSPKHERGPT